RTFRAIEQRALPMDIKEDLLHKIVRLSSIAEDPATNAPDATSVATKEYGKSVSVTITDELHNAFVTALDCVSYGFDRGVSLPRSLLGEGDDGKAGCKR